MASLPELCVTDEAARSDVAPFHVRPATPADVGALMSMKRQLSLAEGSAALACASAADWLRDGFGATPRFSASIAERNHAAVGMVTFNERHFAGWVQPTIYIQDLFVEPRQRSRGIGRALLAEVAAYAHRRHALFVEMNAHAENPARRLYDRSGFQSNANCVTYVLMGAALADLANSRSG